MKILGSGVDIVEVKRVAKSAKKWGKHFLSKIFTARELQYVQKKRNRYESLAARFAVKEAVVKAFGERKDRPTALQQIEIVNTKEGVPQVVFHLPNGKIANRYKGRIVISMSHSKEYAVGTALLIEKK